ncbi:MAG: tyrosine-type recombinase/integrase [Polyangia bacterium]
MLGPYHEGLRWRIVVVTGSKRQSHLADSKQAARRLAAKFQKKVSGQTVSAALGMWSDDKVASGKCLPATVAHQLGRLRTLFSPIAELMVPEVTPRHAGQLISKSPSASVATRRFDLLIARSFFDWCLRRGLATSNPFSGIQVAGRVNRGKQQLRIDEARRFVEAAVAIYREKGRVLCVAALTCLLLGLRASEALNRQVRDLDDEGLILWVPSGKTVNARRRLEVPDLLRPFLLDLCRGKPRTAFIFSEQPGQPCKRNSLWCCVADICKRAEVLRVCPHSLRGLHASLAVSAGVTSSAVAAALGHASFAVTARHYADSSALANSSTAQLIGALGPRDELLHSRDDDTLKALLKLLEERRGKPGN